MARVFDRLPVAEQSPLLIPVHLVATGATLRAVLAWSDFPAAPGAGLTLVNDLDLAVLAPDGTVRLPETAGASPADTRNPIERIDIAATIAGVYTVRSARKPIYPTGALPAALYLRGRSTSRLSAPCARPPHGDPSPRNRFPSISWRTTTANSPPGKRRSATILEPAATFRPPPTPGPPNR